MKQQRRANAAAISKSILQKLNSPLQRIHADTQAIRKEMATSSQVAGLSVQLKRVEDKFDELLAPAGTTAVELEEKIQLMRAKSIRVKKVERMEKEAGKYHVRFLKIMSDLAELKVQQARAPDRRKKSFDNRIERKLKEATTTLDNIKNIENLAGWEERLSAMTAAITDAGNEA